MDVIARNKQIKAILSKVYGSKAVSVTGGKGTSYGWVNITVKTPDPCPFKQQESPCLRYCDGVCKGNSQPITGGWGGTVRQLLFSEIQDKVEELIKGVEMYHFCSDDGYNTMKTCSNTEIDFI